MPAGLLARGSNASTSLPGVGSRGNVASGVCGRSSPLTVAGAAPELRLARSNGLARTEFPFSPDRICTPPEPSRRSCAQIRSPTSSAAGRQCGGKGAEQRRCITRIIFIRTSRSEIRFAPRSVTPPQPKIHRFLHCNIDLKCKSECRRCLYKMTKKLFRGESSCA